jgi:hypothetical protein
VGIEIPKKHKRARKLRDKALKIAFIDWSPLGEVDVTKSNGAWEVDTNSHCLERCCERQWT